MPKTHCVRHPETSTEGAKIMDALERLGQNKGWLADQADITPAYVSLLIRGKRTNPTIKVIKRIEAVLNANIW